MLLRFTTAGGADRIDASGTRLPFDASLPEDFTTGDGADVLRAGPLADVVHAGADADQITGGPGPDQLFGEDGDDVFINVDGADHVDGGPDTDLLDLSTAAGGVAVSQDGVADDGPLGAGADVNVEDVLGSPVRDLLTGGPGHNLLRGGDGDDVIDVRGGGADVADCGPGTGDRAAVDDSDTVTSCEVVDAPAPPLPPPPPPGDSSTGGAGGAADDGTASDDSTAGNGPPADTGPALIPARLRFGWLAFRGGTQADALSVRDLPEGGATRSLCAGKRCPVKQRNAKVSAAGRANLLGLLERRRLPAGTVVEVRMTAPGFIGKVVRFTMRSKGRQPRRASLCIPPGARKPFRCAA